MDALTPILAAAAPWRGTTCVDLFVWEFSTWMQLLRGARPSSTLFWYWLVKRKHVAAMWLAVELSSPEDRDACTWDNLRLPPFSCPADVAHALQLFFMPPHQVLVLLGHDPSAAARRAAINLGRGPFHLPVNWDAPSCDMARRIVWSVILEQTRT